MNSAETNFLRSASSACEAHTSAARTRAIRRIRFMTDSSLRDECGVDGGKRRSSARQVAAKRRAAAAIRDRAPPEGNSPPRAEGREGRVDPDQAVVRTREREHADGREEGIRGERPEDGRAAHLDR